MANRYAVATGNWSNTAIWDGGTLPQAGDDVRANGFTVTINQDINVASIRTDASSPAIAGGGFVVSGNGRIITANIQTGTTTCLTCSTNINFFVYGNINSFGLANGSAILLNAAGASLNLIGNVNGNSTNSPSQGSAILGNNLSYVTITGNVNAGNGNYGYGIWINNVLNTAGSITVTGNVTGGAGTFSTGIYANVAACNITVNGIITGGLGSNATGVYLIPGTLSGSCIVQGNSNIGGSVGVYSSNTSTCTISDAIYTNCAPTSGNVTFKNTSPTISVIKENNTTVTLIEAGSSSDYPTINNVRNGISYAGNSLTGTMIVPTPANVRNGVPTDNTVGTADLTISEFWDYDVTLLNQPNSIGARLKNCSTIESTGDQLAAF